MRPRDRSPHRNPLVILFLLTLLSISAFGWLGWKLVAQERAVEAHRVQERLQQESERIAATLRLILVEYGERLGAWAVTPSRFDAAREEALLVVLNRRALAAFPQGRLIYSPVPSTEPEAPPETFSAGEALEFRNEKPEQAAESYRLLSNSPDPAIRAGALLRLGRVLEKSKRLQASQEAFAQLAALRGVRVAGAPANLVARHALMTAAGSPRSAREALRADLLAGRWQITRGQFEFYWSEVSGQPPPVDALALAEAAAAVWADSTQHPTGPRTIWTVAGPRLAIWRSTPEYKAALIVNPETILQRARRAQAPASAIADVDGRLLAGRKNHAGQMLVRTAGETQLPWTLYVSEAATPAAGVRARQSFILLSLSLMALLLIAGAYFIARAIRREMQVSRLQSDFVAAVSHEFRSPLTSMRQMSEILAYGRAPNEERRQKYYDTLVRETRRLQRLVETLLNFGKMEAGARQYRFEALDARGLVEAVVEEFEPSRRVQVNGAADDCAVQADPEALSLALRNLVDNALKYSPEDQAVHVEWGPDRGRLAIRVRDQGMGIPLSEQNAIFEKFVRGSGAVAANVRGTGVGLAMVRHIVTAHGGEITLESEPGQGSTFTLLLPQTQKR